MAWVTVDEGEGAVPPLTIRRNCSKKTDSEETKEAEKETDQNLNLRPYADYTVDLLQS